MSSLESLALSFALPLVGGALAFVLTQASKRLSAALDAQPAPVKQAVALAWAWLFAAIAAGVGEPICIDGSAFCQPDGIAWRAVVSWALALAIHGAKRRTPKPTKRA